MVKKTDFAGKLKKITLTKTRHAEVEKKLNDLLVKAKLIWVTKKPINRYSILNGAKYFSLNKFYDYFVFQPVIKYFKLITNNIVMA